MCTKGVAGENSEGNEEHGREKPYCLREYLHCHKQTIGRNMDVYKGAAAEGSEGDDEHVIGNWKKGDPCHIIVQSFAELCPAVAWKAELASSEFGYLAHISNQSVEGTIQFYLAA